MPLRGIVELCFRRVGDGFWEFLLWGPLNARAGPCMLGHPYFHTSIGPCSSTPTTRTKRRSLVTNVLICKVVADDGIQMKRPCSAQQPLEWPGIPRVFNVTVSRQCPTACVL